MILRATSRRDRCRTILPKSKRRRRSQSGGDARQRITTLLVDRNTEAGYEYPETSKASFRVLKPATGLL